VTTFTTAIAVIASITTIITIGYAMDITSPVSQKSAFAQVSNESSSSMSPLNQTKANLNTTSATIPTLTTPGAKEFYLFTLETPGVDREKLKVAGDVYSIPTMIANKGDNVTVHFYNLETEPTGRHSFTIGAPYNIDRETIGGQSAVVSFMADQEGVFQYYCKFHTPEMRGQLMVVP
jgi:hypothetical protein